MKIIKCRESVFAFNFIFFVFFLFPAFSHAQVITTVAGTGTIGFTGDGGAATAAQIVEPWGVAADNAGNVFIGGFWSGTNSHRVRRVNALGIITTYAGNGINGFSGDGGPATNAQFALPIGVTTDPAGNLYILDHNNYRIRKVSTAGIVTTIAGNGTAGASGDGGPATAASLYAPYAIAVDAIGNIYFGQWTTWEIRKIDTAGIITTIAGTGSSGFSGDGGPATAATFGQVYGIAVDAAGNIYFSDENNNRVRKINTSGIISTVAGNGGTGFSGDGGPATNAQIDPMGVSIDGAGNLVVADLANNRIRKVSGSGIISTAAGSGSYGFAGDGGPATAASFNLPYGICNDALGNIYVADNGNVRVRKISNMDHAPYFTAGVSQTLTVCQNSVFDSIGSLLAVMDTDSFQPLTWSTLVAPVHGSVGGSWTTASSGAVITPHNFYYTPNTGYSGPDTFKMAVNDGYRSDTIVIYTTVNALPSAIIGSTTVAIGAYSLLSSSPAGTWSSSNTAIVAAGSSSGLITGVATGTATISYTLGSGCFRTITVNVLNYSGLIINTIAGNGSASFSGDGDLATAAGLHNPYGVAVDAAGNLYIADQANNRVRKVSPTGSISTIAGSGTPGFSGDGSPATAAKINAPDDVAVDAAGNVFIADAGNNRIRVVNSSGIISTYAGNGSAGYGGDGNPATAAGVPGPTSVAIDAAGNVFISSDGTRVRKVNSSGIISTFAGNGSPAFAGDGGPAIAASLHNPVSVTADAAGNVFITDQLNERIRKVNSSGIISSIAGTGTTGYSGDGAAATAAYFNNPWGIAVDAAGDVLIGDHLNSSVRKIPPPGIISTVAGDGFSGFTGDGCNASLAELSAFWGICVDGAGNIFIADGNNNRVRKISYNHAPAFVHGHVQNTSVCLNTVDSINTLLAVSDADPGQNETWTILTAPLHGTLVAAYSTTSSGGTITPSGLYYKPTTGYSGHDSFRVVVSDCSIGHDTTKIIVNVTPPPSTITGTTNVCPGLTTTFTDTVGSGTWSSGYPSIATVGSSTGIITGVSSGITTITYSPGVGCAVTKNITVNPAPAPISGPAFVCLGSSVTLSDGSPGGSWSSSNPSVAAIGSSSGSALGSSLGVAIITYMQAGCIAVSALSVNPMPASVSGVSTMCAGAVYVFSDTGTGVWNSGSPGIATVDSFTGLVTGVTAGFTQITYTLAGGCRASRALSVTPMPAVISGPSSVCTGSVINLTDATTGGIWARGSLAMTASIDSFSGAVTGISPGTALITYYAPTGCFVTRQITVNVAPSPIVGDSVCVGSTKTLTESSPGGSWSTGAPAIATVVSGVVTGVAAGHAFITYTMSDGCFAKDSVNVYPPPAAISGASSVCTGASVTLSDFTSGGTWSSSAPGVASVGGTSGVVNGISAGTSVITYSSSTGCMASVIITVNSSPGVITGNIAVCQGATSVLSNSIPGGTWSCSNPSIASIGSSSGLVTAVAAGSATITYLLTSGCLATTVVTVNPVPATISGTPVVCAGSTTTLSDATSGGTWSSPSPTIATVVGSTGVVTGNSAGVAIVSYTLPVTGCYKSVTVTVNAVPAPIAGPSAICVSSIVPFTDPSSGGAWSCTPLSVATIGSGGAVTGGSPGTATITYSFGTGCFRSRLVTVNPLPAAISGPSSVCAGSSITLIGAVGGTWSTAGTIASVGSVSGVVAGLAGGTTAVTYTAPSGCFVTAAVTVNPLPGPISGPSALCAGATLALSVPGSGGTWASSNPAVATVGSGGVVNGITTGSTNITYTGAFGCFAISTITVTTSPLPIAGPSAVCAGNTISLSDPVGSGAWTSSNPAIISVGSLSGVVTGVMTGSSATITYSLGSGCTVTKTVSVSPSPSHITGSAAACIGASIALADTSSGGVWSSSAPSIAAVGSTGLVTTVAAGTATISYTAAGCPATIVFTVNPIPPPITGAAHVCVGSAITLSDASVGGTWAITPLSLASIGSSSGVVSGILPGAATVSYTLGTGCATSVNVTVVANPAAISGPSHVCAGAVAALADATPGGTWSGGSPGIATVSGTGAVTGVGAGITSITYTAAGCIATHMVTVDAAPPAISGPATICTGLTASYSDAVSGGTWAVSYPAVASIGSASGFLSAIAAGPETLTYSAPGGCSTFVTITIKPLPAAISGPSMFCLGHAATVTDASPGGLWSGGMPSVATISGAGVVTPVASGTTIITYTWSGCQVSRTVTVNPPPVAISGNASLCTYSPVYFTDGVPGGAWSTSNPAIVTVDVSSGLVNGVAPGSATITYSTGVGCNTTFTLATIPSPVAITGASSVCLGSTASLSDATPGGTWSSSNPALATISGSGFLTSIAPGTDTIFYSMPVSGCRAVLPFPVIQLPAITGPAALCAWGDTIIVADTWPGSGGIFVSSLVTVANLGGGLGRVTGNAPGVGSVTYAIPAGCSVTRVLTVNALPAAISGGLHLCNGYTAALSDVTTGGVWTSSNPAVAAIGSSSGIVNGLSAGNATIVYTLPVTGCKTDTLVTVTPPPSPIAGSAAVCAGTSTSLIDTVAGGAWTTSNPAVASIGSASGLLTGVAAGSATISYTLGGSCLVTRALTVNASPITFATSGGGAYCLGDSGLHVSLSGSQSGVNYQLYNYYTPLGSPVAGSGAAIDFGPLTVAGPYIVVGTSLATACADTMSGTVSVTVNPLPPAYLVTGGGSYCTGASGVPVGLAGSSSGISYQLFVASVPSGSALPGTGTALDFGLRTLAGIYIIKATDLVTTCSDTMTGSALVTVTPTVIPSVAIIPSAGDTICTGTSELFTATAVNGGPSPIFQWSVNGFAVSSAGSYSYSPSNGDLVSVTLTSNAACALPDTALDSRALTVTDLILPVVNITASPDSVITAGQVVTFTAVVSSAGSSPAYQWQINGVPQPGAPSATFSTSDLNSGDIVSCLVTGSQPCSGQATGIVTITVHGGVGIGSLARLRDLVVEPNPSSGSFAVRGNIGNYADDPITIEIIDILGRTVFKTVEQATGGNIDIKVDTGDRLSPGTYLIALRAGNYKNIVRLQVQRQ